MPGEKAKKWKTEEDKRQKEKAETKMEEGSRKRGTKGGCDKIRPPLAKR
jgi:hypothetical protein